MFDIEAQMPNGTSATLTCTEKFTLDPKVTIRHFTASVHRGVRWFLTERKVSKLISERHLLEKLGLNTGDMLSEATNIQGGKIKVSSLFEQKLPSNSDGKSRVILREFIMPTGCRLSGSERI